MARKKKTIIENGSPISDVINQNSQTELINKILHDHERLKNQQNPLKTLFTGAATGAVTIPTGLAGLALAVPEAVGASVAKMSIPDEEVEKYGGISGADVASAALDNKFLEWTDKLDRGTRDLLNAKQFEDLNSGEQVLDIAGSLINPKQAFQKGINKLLRKGAVKAANTAKIKKINELQKRMPEKSVNELNKLQEVQEVGKNAAKKSRDRTNFAINMVMPGVQITEGAPKVQQAIELATQAGMPLAVNELTRKNLQQEGIFGDYRPVEEEKIQMTLFPDKRSLRGKTFIEEVPNVQTFSVDKKREENNQAETLAAVGGLTTAAIFAPKMINKGLKTLSSGIKEDKIATNLQKQLNLDKALTPTERLDISMTDRFAWKSKAEELGLISEQTKANLARDLANEIDSSFSTGIIKNIGNADIDFGISPQQTLNSIKLLKDNDIETYNKLRDFLEYGSQLQDETNRFNIYGTKIKNNLSPEEYINLRKSNILSLDEKNYQDVSKLVKTHKAFKNLKQELMNNPVTSQIINEISSISKGLLKAMEQSGMYTPEQIQYLAKNRTIDGLFLYKPRVNANETSLLDKVSRFFFEQTPYDPENAQIMFSRGENPIINARDYSDVIERSFKNTLKIIKDNDIKYKTIKEMEKGSLTKISEAIDNYKQSFNDLDFDTITSGKLDDISTVTKDIDNMFNVKELGYRDLTQIDKPITADKSFYELLNKPNEGTKIDTILEGNYRQTKGNLQDAIDRRHLRDDVISVIHNGKEYFYQVPKVTKAAFDLNPKMPSLFAEMMRNTKNFVQSTITGNVVNPLFAARSGAYSTDEAVTMLPKIAEDLGIKDASSLQLLKEFSKAGKEIKAKYLADHLADKITRSFIKTGIKTDSPEALDLLKIERERIRNDINKNLLTQISLSGGASGKPYNTTKYGTFYNINNNTVITPKLVKHLNKIYGQEQARKVVQTINLLQTMARETPSYALTRYLGKKIGAISENKILDVQKLQKVIDSVGTYTANVGRSGTGKGVTGEVANILKNYIPYGNISMQSIATKSRALNIFEPSKRLLSEWVDPKVRYIDFISDLGKTVSSISENKFVQGIFKTAFLPAVIAYGWNHGNQINRDAYYSLSDYDKGKGYVLVNALGEGKHIVIPRDQEIQIFGSLSNTILDTVFGGSKQQEINPAFKNSTVMMESLARSLQIDPPPLIKASMGLGGYKIDMSNLFNDKQVIQSLKNITNPDLTETKFENGNLNAEVYEALNAASGMFGASLGAFLQEFGKTGSIKQDTINASQAYASKIISPTAFWTTKANTYNDTSNEVYKKINLLAKIQSVQKNPQQQQVYNFIKTYNKNRILPIHDHIKDLQKEIRNLNTTSMLNDGTILSFNDRSKQVNEINKKLLKLFTLEREEFNNLDTMIEQLYGKNMTLENFMQKLNN